jgi:stress response protein SCP2
MDCAGTAPAPNKSATHALDNFLGGGKMDDDVVAIFKWMMPNDVQNG